MNILIVGLGAIGSIYATKLKDYGFNVKVLLDKKRIERYKKDGIIFNGKRYDFEYILPENDFRADLIMICVKSTALDESIKNIENFVSEKSIIMSLVNGISSEEKIKRTYPRAKVLYSYYVGHSSMRKGNKITYDGIGKTVFEKNNLIKEMFDKIKIEYETPDDIISCMWQKFIINIGANQTTAILKQEYSCFKYPKAREFTRELMQEGVKIAKHLNIAGYEHFIDKAFDFIDSIPENCKTSMLQDFEDGRETEVDIFAGEIYRLGKKYGIETPRNYYVYKTLSKMKNDIA